MLREFETAILSLVLVSHGGGGVAALQSSGVRVGVDHWSDTTMIFRCFMLAFIIVTFGRNWIILAGCFRLCKFLIRVWSSIRLAVRTIVKHASSQGGPFR